MKILKIPGTASPNQELNLVTELISYERSKTLFNAMDPLTTMAQIPPRT